MIYHTASMVALFECGSLHAPCFKPVTGNLYHFLFITLARVSGWDGTVHSLSGYISVFFAV